MELLILWRAVVDRVLLLLARSARSVRNSRTRPNWLVFPTLLGTPRDSYNRRAEFQTSLNKISDLCLRPAFQFNIECYISRYILIWDTKRAYSSSIIRPMNLRNEIEESIKKTTSSDALSLSEYSFVFLPRSMKIVDLILRHILMKWQFFHVFMVF